MTIPFERCLVTIDLFDKVSTTKFDDGTILTQKFDLLHWQTESARYGLTRNPFLAFLWSETLSHWLAQKTNKPYSLLQYFKTEQKPSVREVLEIIGERKTLQEFCRYIQKPKEEYAFDYLDNRRKARNLAAWRKEAIEFLSAFDMWEME